MCTAVMDSTRLLWQGLLEEMHLPSPEVPHTARTRFAEIMCCD